jgi:hypothetical protein
MTIKFSSIKNNIAAEREGSYVDIIDWPGVSLGVRSLELPAYKLALEQLVQKYARKFKGKGAPPEVRDADVGRLLAQHILYGWKGFDEQYSEEFAMDMLTSSEGRDFSKQVVWAAASLAETDVEFIADTTKNSEKPSVTS